MNKRFLALSAIILAGIIGGTAPFLQKIILREMSPITIAFSRFFFAFLILFPFFIWKKSRTIKINRLSSLLPSSLFFAGNVIIYIIALQYTTSTVSQIAYLLTSAIVLIISYFVFQQKITSNKLLGVSCGLIGGLLLVWQSQNSNLINSLGTIKGNLLLLLSVTSWSLYLITSKKQSQHYSPYTLLLTNITVTMIISFLLLVMTKINPLTVYFTLSFPIIIALIMLIILQSILFFFLVQWAMQYISSFSTTLTTYISPFITAMLGIVFLGEEMSLSLLISAILIFASSYMILNQKK